MKHPSIRLLAPVSTAQVVARAAQLAGKKANQVRTIPQRMIGQWRLYLNYCPECNSCAPRLHSCEVCQADTKAYFSWSNDIRQTWWKRYAAKHRIAL